MSELLVYLFYMSLGAELSIMIILVVLAPHWKVPRQTKLFHSRQFQL